MLRTFFSPLLITLLVINFLWFGTQFLKAEEIFQQRDHCVAYQTEETIFLFVESDVVGKTCEISAQIERKGEYIRLMVNFPISSLDSGIDMRDEDVAEMLLAEAHPEISFISDFIKEEQVSEALNKGSTILAGLVKFAGRSQKVEFPLKIYEQSETWLVTGKLVTSFSEFGLELPSVLGGVIADTRDYLALLVNLHFDRVQGFAELRDAMLSN